MENVRNVAIVLAIAALILLAPGAGTAADAIAWTASAAFLGVLAWFASRLYREYRASLFSIGDQQRGILYGAIGVAVLTAIATSRMWDTPVGTFAWFVLIGLCSYAVYAVYRASREY